jgi:hypothetical protein
MKLWNEDLIVNGVWKKRKKNINTWIGVKRFIHSNPYAENGG